MVRSNIVNVLFPKTPFAPRSEPRPHDAAQIVALPPRRPPEHTPESNDMRPADEVAWALEVAAEDRRLSFAVVDARKRLNRLVRETCPKPTFVPAGEGYEDVSLTLARTVLADRHPFFEGAELELLSAVEAYDAAEKVWNAARKQLSIASGLDSLLARREALRERAAEAHEILSAHGIDPAHG